jgi:hypothetical protein
MGFSKLTPRMLTAYWTHLVVAVCIALFLIHYSFIWRYGVNVPFWDEWETLNADNLAKDLSLQWLFAQHNEHRIVPTKLLVWLYYQINSWNVFSGLLINFLIYGSFLVLLVRFAKKNVPEIDSWIVCSFIFFLLSPINWENHIWSFQSPFLFWLLFYFASIHLLFAKAQDYRHLIGGVACSVMAIYSFSAGLASSAAALLMFSALKIVRAYDASSSLDHKRELIQLMTVVVLTATALALWFVGYEKPALALALPHTATFWSHFVNILSSGFGLQSTAFIPGLVCLLIVVVPIIGELWVKKLRVPPSSWAVYGAAFGVLAALAAIAIGRADFGVEQAKSSRYTLLGMTLIPLSVLAWAIFLSGRARLKSCVIASLWVFFFLSFLDNWTFDPYATASTQRIKGLRCIEDYYAYGGAADCPMLYPMPLADKLNQAKKMNVSFYRDIHERLLNKQH